MSLRAPRARGRNAAALSSLGWSVAEAHRRLRAAAARGAAGGSAERSAVGAADVLGATRARRPCPDVPKTSLAIAEARRRGTARSLTQSAGTPVMAAAARRRSGSGATGSTGGPGRPRMARMAPTRAAAGSAAAGGEAAGAAMATGGREAPARGGSSSHSKAVSTGLKRRGDKMVLNAA